jgi:hypothetical protein
MTLEELENQYLWCIKNNIDFTVLVVNRKNPPSGDNVRIAPGLTGKYLTWHDDGRVVVRVNIKKLGKFIDKVKAQSSESGND